MRGAALGLLALAAMAPAPATAAMTVYGELQGGAGFAAELANDATAARIATRVADADPLALVQDAGDPYACSGANATATAPAVPADTPTALVARRGGCSFAEKVATAEKLGATAVIVINTEEALYGTNGTDLAYLKNPCETNCLVAQNEDQGACEVDCATGLCLANPRAAAGVEAGSYCCALNSLVAMSVPTSSAVQALFVGVADAVNVEAALASGAGVVRIAEKDPVAVDGSLFLILFIGSLVTAVSSFRAARKERREASWLWGGSRVAPPPPPSAADQEAGATAAPDSDDAIDQVTLSLAAVACFLVMCTVVLIGLFYLARLYPREIVIFIQVIFGLSAIFAFSHFVLQPIVRKAWPGATRRALYGPRGLLLGSADEVIGSLLSFTFVAVWFACRHESWAWALLDVLAASVCCMFLVAVRLPNLRLACFMLALFFVYDIFMVFISPSIFGGESVMVEVATAGGSQSSVDPSNSHVCERTQAERMPMLFLVPRFDSPGSYALLGLGDVFIPGLLITYACRFDYLKVLKANKPTTFVRAHAYFLPLCVAYFVALAVTLVANLFDINFSTQVQGQPALLYLVPATVGTFIALAACRGDLAALWSSSYDELYERMVGKPAASVPRSSDALADTDSALIAPLDEVTANHAASPAR